MTLSTRARLTEFATIGLVSGSMLVHQILLTRVCALRLQFHFAFLVISNCLLGFGAAGTVLSIAQARFRAEPARLVGRLTLAYVIALIATYGFLIAAPLPENVEATRIDHILALSLFNLIGAVPFFFSGLVVGLLLSVHAAQADRLYAVDLLCAGLGCIVCPLLLPAFGAGGVFVVSAMLAVAAAMFAAREEYGRPVLIGGAVVLAIGLAIAPRLDRWVPVPAKLALGPTANIPIESRRSVWTANSRIDLTRRKGCVEPIFMLGKHQKDPRPRECAEIAQDATAATTIINFSQQPEALELLRNSMYSATYRLKKNAKVLIIGVGGANDAWAAKINGARSIKGIELNWPILDIHRRDMHHFSRTLIDDPKVEFVADEGRSALMREPTDYDVVQMTGIDTWTALASGAYVLAENYLYTREAIVSMYERLAPEGIIQISRFALTIEALRLLSNISAALTSLGVQHVDRSLVVQATPDYMLSVMVKKGAFSQAEQASITGFAEQSGIEVMYLPDRPIVSPLDGFLRSNDKQKIIDELRLNIEPTDDDKPYFFNFTKWQHPIDSLRYIDEIPAITQGNPFFVLAQLLVSILLSVVFIIWPLARSSGLPKAGAGRILVYFSALGVGFISIEISVIQKLTLLLGQPVYSLTVTLASLLVFTGLGSLRLARHVQRGTPSAWIVPIAIALYIAVINLLSPWVTSQLIAATLPWRIAASVLMLAPLGLLLGIPFAYGLRVTHAHSPQLTAWAWAINGFLSVVGSILTVVVSMNFGFSVVLWLATITYIVGFAALNTLPDSRDRAV